LKAGVLAEPALVGRERELGELQRHLDSAIEGKGKTVLISGEAGSGKSRLASEFLVSAKKRGVGVMAGWCLSEGTAPYFPFVEAFNAYFARFDEKQPASPQRGEAVQALSAERGIAAWLTGSETADRKGKYGIVSPEVWKDQVFAGVAKTLHSLSSRESIVLFIEDIHWADSASLALFHYVARVVNDSERVLLLGTFRSEELTVDAEGRPHLLAEVLRVMTREDLFSEIKLSSLDQASVSRMAENMIGGSLQPELAERLAAESRGNPLFVVESLRMLHERRSLVEEDNRWRLAVDEMGIPSKIRDIILRRLAVLKFPQRRVLDAASVIGEKFDVELLGAVLGQDTLEILETLNIIAQSTSLLCVDGEFYRFDHGKSRDTLYEEISVPLKRGYHARIAERMEKSGEKNGKLPFDDLAYHYAKAGNEKKAVKYALEAGRDALLKFSSSQAINHFIYVVQTLGEDPRRMEDRLIALEGLGDAYMANNTFSEALKTFEQLSNVTTGVLRLRALRKTLASAFFQGNVPRMIELFAKAEEYLPLDRLEAARIYRLKAGFYALKGQPVLAGENGQKAVRIFKEEYSLADAAHALAGEGFGSALTGDIEKGLAGGLFAVAFFGEMGNMRQQMSTYYEVGSTFGLCGLFPEELKIFEKALEIEEEMKLGDYHTLAQIYWQIALTFEAQNLELALSKTLKALEYADKTDSASVKGMVYGRLVIEYVMKDDIESAEKYFEKLMKLPPQSLQSGWVQLYTVKAFYFAGKKDWQESMRHFREHFELIQSWRGSSGLASPTVEAGAKSSYAWALFRQGRKEEAASLMQEANRIRTNAEKRFEHANVYTNLMICARVTVGQLVELRLDLVNVSRGVASLSNIQGMLPMEFEVVASQPGIVRNGSSVQLKDNGLYPFTVRTIKLTLKATKTGNFSVNPQVFYINDLQQTKICAPRPITITVKPAEPEFEVLPGRVSTGSPGLDGLLLGGIPQNLAVVLASPSVDERTVVVENFLKIGAEQGEITFYVTAEAANAKTLAEEYPNNFYLVVCNIQADAMVVNLPNVFKLKGIESLTDIDIALTKAFRTLKPQASGKKRMCIDIVSDVLLQHHAVTTRRWLSTLLPNLKAQGFTTLAVINPHMHSQEEVQALLGLFEGEIHISEREVGTGVEKVLRIRRLFKQKYLEGELVLNEEK